MPEPAEEYDYVYGGDPARFEPDAAEAEWVDASYSAICAGEVFEFQSRPGARYVVVPGALLSLGADGGLPMQAYFSNPASRIRFTGERVRFVIEPIASQPAH
jgi:hypothetical protein